MQEYILGLILTYKYVIIFPATFILGPIVSLFSGFLLRLGYVELLPTCLALAGGELTADVVWYWLGRYYGKSFVDRFGHYVGITEHALERVKTMFHRYHDRIIILSKITSGFGFSPAIFLTAGLSHVPFRRYMVLNVIGQVVWTTGLLSIGYFFGHIYLQVGSIFEKMALLASIVLIVVSLVGFGRYMARHISSGA